MNRWLPLLLIAVLVGCSPPSKATDSCKPTPAGAFRATDQTLYGLSDNGAFFYFLLTAEVPIPSSPPRRYYELGALPTDVVVSVFLLDNPQTGAGPLPDRPFVRATNTASQTTLKLLHTRQLDDLGTHYRGHYILPEPGCWRLSIDGASDSSVVIAVRPTSEIIGPGRPYQPPLPKH